MAIQGDAPSLREPVEAERGFPVLLSGRRTVHVPWGLMAPHERQANVNHGQSLRRLAERGGLSWGEMIAVLEDRPWRRMDHNQAKEQVEALVAAYEDSRKDGSSQNDPAPDGKP